MSKRVVSAASEAISDSVVLPQMVWMEIDLANKELPLRVADTAKELARLCRTTENNVMSAASKARRGRRRSRFIKVWIGEDD